MNSRVRSRSGLLLAGVQAVLMLSTAAMFWLDRQVSPRVWVPTEPVDPSLPIRGRYITLNMVVPLRSSSLTISDGDLLNTRQKVHLIAVGDRLVADIEDNAKSNLIDGRILRSGDDWVVRPDHELAFFIPPDVQDPSIQPDGRTLWVKLPCLDLGPHGLYGLDLRSTA